MQFAKLFDFDSATGQGQLLAQLHDSEAREEADAPFQIVLKTIGPYGITMTLAHGYSDESKRDYEFRRLDQEQAAGHYHRMQATLLEATD